jgi:hypothetical protein
MKEMTLKIMQSIINSYIKSEINRDQAVEQLINEVDIDFIYNLDVTYEPQNFFITDCYWTIKHLTESGFETNDEEIRYFYECFNGGQTYSLNEKLKHLQNYFDGLNEK